MRLRHKPWAKDFIADHPQYVIAQPERHQGRWNELFAQNQPLQIEVGSGKGRFVVEMAKAHPDINFIAIELQSSVIVSILEKQIEAKLPNLLIINTNGRHLADFFSPGEISRVYLNFSDPWPKTRHEKRRLTSKDFLDDYRLVLATDGDLHFKTDNQGLFEYSLCSLSQNKWLLEEVSLDLHQSDFEGNIMTEYEEKFSDRGARIYRLQARPKRD